MFERFTDRARRAVVLAQQEARALDHDYIGTEHILLGLVHVGDGVAHRTLDALGVSLDGVREEVKQIVGRGRTAPSGDIPFTPRAKKVLELSLRESLQLGHDYIGTEHILLGLVREGEGVGAQVLRKLGIDLDRVRQEVAGQVEAVGSQRGRTRRWFRRGEDPTPDVPVAGWPEHSLLEEFDDSAWDALIAARQSARRRRAGVVAMRDLLVGVASVVGPAAAALRVAGLDAQSFESVDVSHKSHTDDRPAALPFADGARAALRWAAEESRRRTHPAASTAHILLAVLVNADDEVDQVLDAAGVARGDLHAETARVLGDG